MIGAGIAMKHTLGRGMFPEEDLLNIVHKHAKWGAIAIAIPFLPVVDSVLYCIIL